MHLPLGCENIIGLLFLPAELRNVIYEFVLGDKYVEFISMVESVCPAQSALTKVCRQLRKEVLPMYYA